MNTHLLTQTQTRSVKANVNLLQQIFMLCLFSLMLSGCSAWTKATSSSQWIEIDPVMSDPKAIMMSERAMVTGDQAAQICALYALGTAHASGPADITRSVSYNPSNGTVDVSLKTANSTWLGGAFRGLWSSGSFAIENLATMAAGAAP